MKDLESIIVKLCELDSLMYVIEGEMIAVNEAGSDMKHLHNLIYLLWGQLQQMENDVEEINGHIKVANAVLAVNHVEELERELAEAKRELAQLKRR